jgi:hypothetical protein
MMNKIIPISKKPRKKLRLARSVSRRRRGSRAPPGGTGAGQRRQSWRSPQSGGRWRGEGEGPAAREVQRVRSERRDGGPGGGGASSAEEEITRGEVCEERIDRGVDWMDVSLELTGIRKNFRSDCGSVSAGTTAR